MAPLPQSNTQRWYYTYQNAFNEHVMIVRGDTTATIEDADALIGNMLSGIGGLFVESVITGVEHSAQGSNLRFPVVSERTSDTFGTGVGTIEQDSSQLTFVGRTIGGRRTRFTIFGYSGASSAWRVTSAENSAIGAVANLFSADGPVPVGIDLFPAVWHQYANVNVNDHWVKEARG